MIFTMTVSPSILPAVCLTAHGYRSVIWPAFPPRAATPSLQIFSDGWVIWSVRVAALRKSRKPTAPLTITVTNWSLNSIQINQLFETLLLGLKAKATTKETMLKLYHKFGFDAAFARADIMKLAGVTSSPAGALIDKLKSAGLIEPVAGQGKGKYRFVLPKE